MKLLQLKADVLCEGHAGMLPGARRWESTSRAT